jgi:hypothetical protein
MKTLTVSKLWRPSPRGGATVPHLRLTGRWLALAGFAPGAKITVAVVDGALQLKPGIAAK